MENQKTSQIPRYTQQPSAPATAAKATFAENHSAVSNCLYIYIYIIIN